MISIIITFIVIIPVIFCLMMSALSGLISGYLGFELDSCSSYIFSQFFPKFNFPNYDRLNDDTEKIKGIPHYLDNLDKCQEDRFRESAVSVLEKNIDLSWSILSGTSFSSGDNYDSVDFRNCDLSNAVMRNLSLKRANFCGADMRNCDLRGSDLEGAVFYGAKTEGMRVDKCLNLDQTSFTSKNDYQKVRGRKKIWIL